MKVTAITCLLICSLACFTTKNTSMNLTPLDGIWIPVKQELGGRELPAAIYQSQTLTIADSSYTVKAESVDKGTLVYKDGQMDIYGKDGVNKGKHFMAIYKLEDGQLTICYNLKGDSYPKEFETKSNPLFFLSVFKKQ